MRCTLQKGAATGTGLKLRAEATTRTDCMLECARLRETDSTVNGVTIVYEEEDEDDIECFCNKRMVGIRGLDPGERKTETCVLVFKEGKQAI